MKMQPRVGGEGTQFCDTWYKGVGIFALQRGNGVNYESKMCDIIFQLSLSYGISME